MRQNKLSRSSHSMENKKAVNNIGNFKCKNKTLANFTLKYLLFTLSYYYYREVNKRKVKSPLTH